MSYLRKFFNYLIERQTRPNLREQEYKTFIQSLEEERNSYGHERFPDYVQETMDSYDIKTPYVPENEIEVVLSLFRSYLNCPYLSNLETVSRHAESLLKNNWEILYTKRLFSENNLSEREKTLCDYYDSLLELREVLLAINIKTNNLVLYFEANNILNKIMKSPNLTNEPSFLSTIAYFDNLINSQINSLKFFALLKLGVIGSMVSIGFCLFTEESFAIAIFRGLATSSLVTLGAKVLTDRINNTFFGKKRTRDNDGEDIININSNVPQVRMF